MPDELPWEDGLLERKVENDLKDLLKTLVAFSNSVRPGHTATILIGEKDDGTIQGVRNPDNIQRAVESDKHIDWIINGTKVPFNPIQIRFIHLTHPYFAEEDDLVLLSNALQLPAQIIRNLIEEIHAFPYSHVRNLRFKNEGGRYYLYADVDGTAPGLQLRDLSSRETERIFIEFATAAARVSGRYAPTVLILDGCPLILFKGIFDFYSHHLLDPENQFQTIMCIPTQSLNLDALRWKGWEVIRTSGTSPNISITQQLRMP
jgi:hypothetical protein